MKVSCSSLGMLVIVGVVVVFAGLCEAQMSEEEQVEILRAHNTYRGQVDPVAINMEQMVRVIAS